MKNILKGINYPFISIGYFFKYPKLILLSIIPFIINLLLYSFILFYSLYRLKPKIISLAGLENSPDALNYILYFFLTVVVFFILIIISYIIFTIFSGLFTGPFNENISKFIEEKITSQITVSEYGFFKDLLINIKSEIAKLILYISVIIILFFIGFLPIIGSIFTMIALFLFSCFYSALDFLDYPMARKNYSLMWKIKSILSKPSLSFGFGLSASLFLVIPFINILLKPIFVVAGTLMYFKENYN